jgi:hypothetical protein
MNEQHFKNTNASELLGCEKCKDQVEVTLRIPEDIQRVFGTEPCVKWKGESAEELLLSLWDVVLHLDLGSSLVWEDLSQSAGANSKSDLGKSLSNCLGGRTEVSAREFSEALERSKVFISALLLAISGKHCEGFQGGIHQYANEFESKFRPDRIRECAQMEMNWYESLDKVCWHRYQKLAEDEEMEAEKIEYKLRRALAEEALWWMEANGQSEKRT